MFNEVCDNDDAMIQGRFSHAISCLSGKMQDKSRTDGNAEGGHVETVQGASAGDRATNTSGDAGVHYDHGSGTAEMLVFITTMAQGQRRCWCSLRPWLRDSGDAGVHYSHGSGISGGASTPTESIVSITEPGDEAHPPVLDKHSCKPAEGAADGEGGSKKLRKKKTLCDYRQDAKGRRQRSRKS